MSTGEFNAGGNPAISGLASHPGRSRNTPNIASCSETRITSGLI